MEDGKRKGKGHGSFSGGGWTLLRLCLKSWCPAITRSIMRDSLERAAFLGVSVHLLVFIVVRCVVLEYLRTRVRRALVFLGLCSAEDRVLPIQLGSTAVLRGWSNIGTGVLERWLMPQVSWCLRDIW